MNVWENAVITSKGLALLAKLNEGNALTITKAMTGSGYVTPGLLQQQTEVSNPKQELSFKAVSYPEAGKCKMPCFLTNDGLSTGYTATQVGIYANDPDEGEILYFITQAASGQGTVIPSEGEMAGYSAEWTFYFAYGQADAVDVTVDPSNTVSREEMNMLENAVSNTLKGSATGSLLAITDVSPIEHTLDVKISGENIDMSAVRLTRYGANILDVANAPIYRTDSAADPFFSIERKETGFKATYIRSINGSTCVGYYLGTIDEMKGKKITISGTCVGNVRPCIRVGVCSSADGGHLGNDSYKALKTFEDQSKATYTIPNTAAHQNIVIFFYIAYSDVLAVDDVVEWSNLQVQIGEAETEYEPYKEPTIYIPNENGIVKGVTSLYPTTILELNAAGATMDCVYNKDLTKAGFVKEEDLPNVSVRMAQNAVCDDRGKWIQATYAEKPVITEIVIPNNWTSDSGTYGYKQTVSIEGILETDAPIVDIVVKDASAANKLRLQEWANVYRITTANGSITLYASKAPEHELRIQLKVVH